MVAEHLQTVGTNKLIGVNRGEERPYTRVADSYPACEFAARTGTERGFVPGASFSISASLACFVTALRAGIARGVLRGRIVLAPVVSRLLGREQGPRRPRAGGIRPRTSEVFRP